MKNEILKELGVFKKLEILGANHNIIMFENGRILTSYDSTIAVSFYHNVDVKYSNQIFFGKDWKFSSTTSKFRNRFLGRTSKWSEEQVTQNKIKVIDF